MTCYLDLLPAELLDQIAAADRAVYWPLAVGYPRFARSLTPGRRVDFAISFGHDVHVVGDNGVCYLRWTLNDTAHRTDGPAIEFEDGDYQWYNMGDVSGSQDSPASKINGIIKWRNKSGALTRDNGPAIQCQHCGSEVWFNNRGCTRDSKPAVIINKQTPECDHEGICNEIEYLVCDSEFDVLEWDYVRMWVSNDKLHREDGPALTYHQAGDTRHNDYYKHGVHFNE